MMMGRGRRAPPLLRRDLPGEVERGAGHAAGSQDFAGLGEPGQAAPVGLGEQEPLGFLG